MYRIGIYGMSSIVSTSMLLRIAEFWPSVMYVCSCVLCTCMYVLQLSYISHCITNKHKQANSIVC